MSLSEVRANAACHGKNPDLWFPERDQGPKGSDEAKAICEACPVRSACLDWALESGETFGIWGGKTPAERRRMK